MGSDSDHSRYVLRHRNVFENQATTATPGTPTENDSNRGSKHRTILSDAGKPCILGAKCSCICEHGHVSYYDGEGGHHYHEATVTASVDRCPEKGHGINV